jgi:hemerythrin
MQSADAANSVPVFFGELFKAISSHFALEETLMRAANYPHFREHKEDHEDLLDELRAIMDDYDAAEGSLPADTLGKALDVWFTDHFKTHDSKLHEVMGPH